MLFAHLNMFVDSHLETAANNINQESHHTVEHPCKSDKDPFNCSRWCSFYSLNVWTSGRLNAWTPGRLNAWTSERLDVWTYGRLHIWTSERRLNVWTSERLDAWTSERLSVWASALTSRITPLLLKLGPCQYLHHLLPLPLVILWEHLPGYSVLKVICWSRWED